MIQLEKERKLFCEHGKICYEIALFKEAKKKDIKDIMAGKKFAKKFSKENLEYIWKSDAKILLNIENGVRKEYDIKIEKIYKNNNADNKSMIIKVTDEDLIELTGGIVQRNEWSTNNTE